MEKFLPILTKCRLFQDIPGDELTQLLPCLKATHKTFAKGSCIFASNESLDCLGIVLAGSVHVIQADFWGNSTILTRVAASELFGEAYACAGQSKIPVSVVAAEQADVLLLEARYITTNCSVGCKSHSQLIENMLHILAGKNILLVHKIGHLTRRTTREKLLSYLSEQALQAGTRKFTIPFNRQELADYLAVDRSAMSHELAKMRQEGLLAFQRSTFELLR